MYDPQLIFPCVQCEDTTVVGLAIKILSRRRMGLTQFNFEFSKVPKEDKAHENDHECHISVLFEGNASFWESIPDVVI